MDIEQLLRDAFGIRDAAPGPMVTIQSKYWFDDELGCRWIVSDDGGAFKAIAHSSLLDAQYELGDRASYYELADYKVQTRVVS